MRQQAIPLSPAVKTGVIATEGAGAATAGAGALGAARSSRSRAFSTCSQKPNTIQKGSP